MTNLTSKFSNWLAVLALLLVGCGSSLPPDEAEIDTAPALITSSPCLTQPCNWNFVGPNPLNPVGSTAGSSSLAIDPSGNMVVAYVQGLLSPTGTYVRRWDGSAWVQYGGVVSATEGANNISRVVLDGAGNPVVVSQSLVAPYNVFVSRWINNAWVNTADLLGCPNRLGIRGFAVDTSGRPVVACNVQVGEFEIPRIQINRWNGTVWVALPEVVGAANPRLVPLSNNRLFMAYDDLSNTSVQVSRWNGSAWVKLGTGIANANVADLKLGINDWPVVAYFEVVPGNLPRLWVRRWNANTFVPVGPRLVETYKGNFPSLGVQGSTIMVAFWQKDFPLQVWRYNAASNAWVQIGSAVYNADSHVPSLALKPSGDPVVAWHGPANDGSLGQKVFVKDWSPVGRFTVNVSGVINPSVNKKVWVTGLNFDSGLFGSSKTFSNLALGTYTINAEAFVTGVPGKPSCRLHTPDLPFQTINLVAGQNPSVSVIFSEEACE